MLGVFSSNIDAVFEDFALVAFSVFFFGFAFFSEDLVDENISKGKKNVKSIAELQVEKA